MNQCVNIRVLVVDDSAFMRRIIGDLLAAESCIEIVGRARNGAEALQMLKTLTPDVITLDMEMPGMNGLEVLREIMASRPTPVIMVSSLTREGADITMQALEAGAVDFVTKPSGTISLDMAKVQTELRKKVIGAMGAVVCSRRVARQRLPQEEVSPPRKSALAVRKRVEMVVIASSTGGPMALQDLIPMLPANFPVPILMVQHMPGGFTASFAKRLDERAKIRIAEAYDGMPVHRGVGIIAPGGYHLTLERRGAELCCRLSETPPVRSVRPSADVLFTSVAEVVGGNVLALILTGMGKDGMDGTRLLREKGAFVIAQSKETCVIYGMPGAVVDSGLADEVLPLNDIAAEMERLVAG